MNGIRLGLALAGFVLAVLSVVFDERRLGWAAIALLAGSLALRLWLKKRSDSHPGQDESL